MKLALVIERFDPIGSGAERSAADIVGELVRRGHDVTIFSSICLCDPPPGAHMVTLHRRPTYSTAALRRFRRWAASRIAAGPFDSSLSVTGYLPADVVMPLGGVARELHQRISEPALGKRQRLVRRIKLALSQRQRLLLKLEAAVARDPAVRQIAAVNSHIASQLRQHYAVAESKLALIAPGSAMQVPGTEQQATWRRAVRQGLGIADDTVVYLFIAQELGATGGHHALTAVRALVDQGANPTLLMAGENRYVQHQLAARLNIRRHVKFLGATERMAALFAAADVMLHPTLYDAAGRTTMEALMAGRPVITTRYNGLSEFVEPRHQPPRGRVIDEPTNTAALAQAMKALADGDELARCSAATRGLDEQWSIHRHVDALEALMSGRRGAVMR